MLEEVKGGEWPALDREGWNMERECTRVGFLMDMAET